MRAHRWHRWGRVHWHFGSANHRFDSYGWSFKRHRLGGFHALSAGPLFVAVWPRRRAHG